MRKLRPQTVVGRLVAAGYRPYAYSGRGMYGTECVAISLPHRDDTLVRRLGGTAATWDQMGRGVVAYWPALAWSDDLDPLCGVDAE